ncbi:ZYBA0S10-00386g1_1 [Zygosaccharomyces bailii CLIB 213]|uniref:ZYBA0S10-00386g1_1 n=1 Tax=Zygosaccharomyces bailii (strain CLIB 213 / ATCC 58445 / CBS 680 / BCRC 21525 / NBRC 1098 / NCYC 1416 / NRRL Y-2227) TaxID=1333698 RepID=A0A8J2T8S1_ZYGB2|nr:ZYBA0S10-00386g1_1 [Zygosaccharomyces bailii CLIB 213]
MAKKKNQARSNSSKRAQNALELAQDALGEGGYSSEENSDSYSRNGVVNLLKKTRDNDEEAENGNESFEDEDLDSDEAMGSDDDYDVMNSKFSQTIRDQNKIDRSKQTPEGEEDDEYTSIDEDELLPLSEVWDRADAKEEASENEDQHFESKLELQNDDNEVSDSNDSESSYTSEAEEDPFDEISDSDTDVKLSNVTSSLMKDTNKHAFRKLKNYGVGKENEYALPSNSSENGSSKLNLVDMMGVVDDEEAASRATLVKDSSSTLSVPLPQRIQQRHERKAAYEISKDEMDKWKDIVQQNRRAEHITFPNTRSALASASSTFTRSSGQPQNELEEKVEKVLQESNLVDPEKGSTFEELATAKMSPEEMKRRTAEMRLLRDLMFREERKAKRLKKIKSKTYRRIKKKEMLKNKALAGVSDESDLDADVARAKERMTLKHKANSKWAKDIVKHGMTNDAETREEMEHMLRQGERLRTKILDRQSDEQDGASLSEIEKEEEFDKEAQKTPGKSGVMNMAFMKAAEAREREENRKTISTLKEARESGEADDNDEKDDENNVQLNQGRRIYNSMIHEGKEISGANLKSKVNNHKQEIPGDIEVRYAEVENRDIYPPTRNGPDRTDLSNPWLDGSDEENDKHVKQSSKISVVDKDSTKLAKHLYKLGKKNQKHDRPSEQVEEEFLLGANSKEDLTLLSQEPSFMFKQQDVIAEAFAGDDVVASFEEEKKRVAESEDDKEEDVTLPGWGEWAGAGANPKKKRKFVKKVKGTVQKDKRRDKSLKNVIINEKLNKKNMKYQSSAVPFPFESKEQYERSLRMPIGQEWTSRSSHQKMIKPRILTRPSEVIDPLKAPFK